MKNSANIVTLLRIALIPVFMWAALGDFGYSGTIALVIFIVAGLTDALDGYMARALKQVSNFGKIMDPLADKLLVISALLVFIEKGQIGSWAVALIVARELAVTSLRVVAISEGRVIPAGLSGKIKTVTQFIIISVMLTAFHSLTLWGGFTVDLLGAWIMAAVTVWSGCDYFARNCSLFSKKA